MGKWTDAAQIVRNAMDTAGAMLTDEQAATVAVMFPAWKTETEYSAGDRVLYSGILYKVLQAHTSQETWTPDAAVSLFARVLLPEPDALPAWEQPESTNPYMTGDRVTHDGKAWVSTLDNNVWEPGVYGWEEIDAHD